MIEKEVRAQYKSRSYQPEHTHHFEILCWVIFKKSLASVVTVLNLSRNHLRILTGLVNSSECDKCNQASETASHILRDCEALVSLRYRGTWVVILWNQVTWETSLLATYCTLLKVQDSWMNELKSCTIDRSRSRCMGHLVLALLYSILFIVIAVWHKLLFCFIFIFFLQVMQNRLINSTGGWLK